jgi:hypothetical protein
MRLRSFGASLRCPHDEPHERINLNVPAEVRDQLRSWRARGPTESELARALLVSALERRRREDFYRRVARAYTPSMRERDLEVRPRFESLGG